MAGVTPRQVYQALINAGFSTVQAIGIMANGIAESGLNPETRVIDSNGYYSDGIWQFNEESYPNAASLVTGNASADLGAQVGYLKAHVSGQALQGSTGGQVAGNFAQFFERCQTCSPGGTSYNQRVANATDVAQWASSGKWPKSAGSIGTGTSSSSSGSSSATGPDCAFGPKLPVIGQVCLVKRSTIRHLVGGGLMVSGGALSLSGVILLAAFAFRASGAQRAAGQIVGTVTPVRRVYERQASRQAAARAVQTRASRTAIRQGNTQARKAAGSPVQQRRAVAGQAPRRPAPTPAAAARPPRAVHHE